MPGTITKDLTDIDRAENAANWLSLGTWATAFAANADMSIEITNCCAGRVSGPAIAYALAPHAGLDVTDGKHIFMWVKNVTWPATNTKALGGISFIESSDNPPTVSGNFLTNSKEYNLAGNDTAVVDGWVCYVINPNGTADNTTGSPVLTAIRRLGVRVNMLLAVGAGNYKPSNIVFDVIRYGSGLFVRNGTEGSPVDFVSIYNADKATNVAAGVLISQAGVYFEAGKLKFGDAAQAAVTYFKDTDQVVVFQNFPVAATFYEWLLAGAASFNTTVQLGNYSGGVASNGCTIRGATGAVWTLTVGANCLFKAYASALSQLRAMVLNSNCELRYCTVANFGLITQNGAVLANSKFTAPTGATAILANNITNISNCTFESDGSNHALELPAACAGQSYNLVGCAFVGYAASDGSTGNEAIYNNSNGEVWINVSGCSGNIKVRNANGNCITHIVVSGQVTLTGLKPASDVVVYSAGTETVRDSADQVNSYNYLYTIVESIDIGVFKAGYVPFYIRNYALSGGNTSVPISQEVDRAYLE